MPSLVSEYIIFSLLCLLSHKKMEVSLSLRPACVKPFFNTFFGSLDEQLQRICFTSIINDSEERHYFLQRRAIGPGIENGTHNYIQVVTVPVII